MGMVCSSVSVVKTSDDIPSVGGCPICDNRPSKDATWAEQFHLTQERLQHLAECNENTSFCSTFQGLVDLLTAQTTSDVERFWVLFHWVQLEGRRQQPRKSLPANSPFEFLRAVKHGKRSYADLYKKLCSTAGLKCKTVTGLCKSIGDHGDRSTAEKVAATSKSSWNEVAIDGKRALVDCGFELKFEPNRMPPVCYFMSLPTHFAKTHFPDDKSHQLLEVSVTLSQFRSHGSCLASSARGKSAAEGSPVKDEEKPEERHPSGKQPMGESMGDNDSAMTLDELRDSRLKPLPEGCTHHIMISYSHKQKKEVLKIREHLDKVGYRVWIDEGGISGTIARSISAAIQEAAIVLVAFSEDYVKSHFCKREVNFAQEKKKEIVPLKMTDYTLDDWLGLLLAGILYVDFSQTQSFADKLQELEFQIETRLENLRKTEKKENV
ncbi:KY [Branchiostoma lanceolatum]|uniref:KY protein n=1 Tax=Branchiostoma lanceolatum TaxID=7740 RepID=A0A8K0A4U2_BRALA|nr:KY [Branchiostoma lanceolatum]